MTVTFDVSDHDALVDDVISIVIRGLSNHQAVTLHAAIEENKVQFGSCGCFYADKTGVVDVTVQKSHSGTYTGVSSMGLFWSMKSAPSQEIGVRFIKYDASLPLQIHLRVCDGHMTFEELYTDSPKELAQLKFRRWYMGKGVRRIKVWSGRIRGCLFLPEGPGPFLGVIDMFGVVGSLLEFRAALLASRGFAALALPYFIYEDLPKFVNELELEYFLEAINWLSDRPEVISDRIGMLGISRGGEIALYSAYYSSKVKAVVSIAGAGFFGDPLLYEGKLIGQPDEIDGTAVISTDEGFIYRYILKCDKENYIPIWEKDVKVLLIVGEDDQAMNPANILALHQCYPAHKQENCKLLHYPGAGHLIEPPYAPHCRTTFKNIRGYESFKGKMSILWGGYTEQHAFAQEDSWKNILQHFKTHLPPNATEKAESKL